MAAIRWLVLLECLSLAVACSFFACHVRDKKYCKCISREMAKCRDSEGDKVAKKGFEVSWKYNCDGCSLLTSLPLLLVTGVVSLLLSR